MEITTDEMRQVLKVMEGFDALVKSGSVLEVKFDLNMTDCIRLDVYLKPIVPAEMIVFPMFVTKPPKYEFDNDWFGRVDELERKSQK